MTHRIEKAIICAAVMHQGKIRKQRRPSDADDLLVRRCVERIAELTDRPDGLSC